MLEFTDRWKLLYDALHGATVRRGGMRERLLERILVSHGIDVEALNGLWDFEIPSRRIRFDSKSAGWSWGTKAEQAVHKYRESLPDGWTGYLVPFVPPSVVGWKWPIDDIEGAGILVRPAHIFLEEITGEPVDVYRQDEELFAGLLDARLASTALPETHKHEMRTYLYPHGALVSEVRPSVAAQEPEPHEPTGPESRQVAPDRAEQAALNELLSQGFGLIRYRSMTVGSVALLRAVDGKGVLATIWSGGRVEWHESHLDYMAGDRAFVAQEALLRTADH